MPKSFHQFTNEQLLEANSVNLELFLPAQGEQLLRSGRDKRLASDHSITIRGNAWYDFSKERGGLAISFMKEYYGLSFANAVNALLGNAGVSFEKRVHEQQEHKEFMLPHKNGDMRRVFAYLVQSRCIPQDIIAEFVHQKMVYESADNHNVVFVGYDTDGNPKHAHCRSTCSFGKAIRQTVWGSDSSYSFHFIGSNERLYVFEAPIDMLSYISLIGPKWKENSYVALCGVSGNAMMRTLEDYPQLKEIIFCLDNDLAGIVATQRLRQVCEDRGYLTDTDVSCRKDWNEDLCVSVSEEYGMIQEVR